MENLRDARLGLNSRPLLNEHVALSVAQRHICLIIEKIVDNSPSLLQKNARLKTEKFEKRKMWSAIVMPLMFYQSYGLRKVTLL